VVLLWTSNKFYFKFRSTYQIIPCNSMDVKKQISSSNDYYIFLYKGCVCFWICMGVKENKIYCRKSGFNVCTYHHLLLRFGNSLFNRGKNKGRFLFIGFFICFRLFVCFFFLCLQVQHVRIDWSSLLNAFSHIDQRWLRSCLVRQTDLLWRVATLTHTKHSRQHSYEEVKLKKCKQQ
jgi:hypothetical protein